MSVFAGGGYNDLWPYASITDGFVKVLLILNINI